MIVTKYNEFKEFEGTTNNYREMRIKSKLPYMLSRSEETDGTPGFLYYYTKNFITKPLIEKVFGKNKLVFWLDTPNGPMRCVVEDPQVQVHDTFFLIKKKSLVLQFDKCAWADLLDELEVSRFKFFQNYTIIDDRARLVVDVNNHRFPVLIYKNDFFKIQIETTPEVGSVVKPVFEFSVTKEVRGNFIWRFLHSMCPDENDCTTVANPSIFVGAGYIEITSTSKNITLPFDISVKMGTEVVCIQDAIEKVFYRPQLVEID